MKVLQLFGRRAFDLCAVAQPWDGAQASIYDRLSAPDFADSELDLRPAEPDDEGISFAAGLMDAMVGGLDEDAPSAEALAKLVSRCLPR